MALDEAGNEVREIEKELERIQAFLAGSPPPNEAMQLLARQVTLLLNKSAAFRRHRALEEALKVATEAAALVEGLRPRAEQQDPTLASDLEEHWFEAHSAVGLAQVDGRALVAARKTLRFLRTQLQQLQGNNRSTLHVARLESALEDEEQERTRLFHAQATQRDEAGEIVGQDWDETHLLLEVLVEEIAERMTVASSLAARVSHPERFQDFLTARLRSNLQKVGRQPVGEISHVEVSIKQKAQERGKHLQMVAWSSGEMLRAEAMRFQDGTACTDEALAPMRERFQILGLPHPEDPTRFAYPRWQLGDAHGATIAILRELKSLPEWSIWHFFHQRLVL